VEVTGLGARQFHRVKAVNVGRHGLLLQGADAVKRKMLAACAVAMAPHVGAAMGCHFLAKFLMHVEFVTETIPHAWAVTGRSSQARCLTCVVFVMAAMRTEIFVEFAAATVHHVWAVMASSTGSYTCTLHCFISCHSRLIPFFAHTSIHVVIRCFPAHKSVLFSGLKSCVFGDSSIKHTSL
jgi:hypothetical protein